MANACKDSGYVDNWQAGKTAIECNLHMLATEDCSDVIFLVGSEKHVVRAHRYVLVSRSCVFHAMFCGPLAEKGEVTILDIELDVFRVFLRYLYSDTVNITPENVTGLLYTSRKYAVDGLCDQCTHYLEQSLSGENVCQILEQCHTYGEVDLEQKALKILTEAGENVITSEGFVDLCENCMSNFLKSEQLNLKEEEIFRAAMAWAREECKRENAMPTPENIRKFFGDLRYEIRFVAFQIEYLVKVVGPSGVLTNDERIRIIDRNYDSEIDITPFKSSLRQSNKDRVDNTKDFPYHIVNRYESVTKQWGCSGFRDAVSFSANRDILLAGCQLYGPCLKRDSIYTLNILLFNDRDEVVAEPLPTRAQILKAQEKPNDLMFADPVTVQAGRAYTICVTMSGAHSFFGKGGRTSVIEAGVEFTFYDSPKSRRGWTTAKQGQIPGLIWRI